MSASSNDAKPVDAGTPLFGEFSVDEYRPMKVIVIGAGAGGILAGVRFQQYIPNLSLTIYEKLDGIGGTWYANKYPGLTCDVPSHCYQFSFEHKTDWTRVYSPGAEILSYLRHVSDKYKVTPLVKLRHELVNARFDEASGKWHVRVRRHSESDPSGFEEFDDDADFVFSSMGSLSRWNWPEIEGLSEFKGKLVHSADWNVGDEELATWVNKKVGVIGLGSSAVQCVSALGPKVGTLHNFVRGKCWVAPPLIAQKMSEILGRDIALDPDLSFTEEEKKSFGEDPKRYIEFRRKIEHDYNGLHQVTLKDSPIQQYARATFTAYMTQMLEKKPGLADLLLPDFSVSCRRLTPTPGYLRAIVQDNVDVVPTPIKRITPTGIETDDGKTYDLDVLVCATGFDTSFRYPFPIIGRNGTDLRDKWTPFPETYFGLCTDGFPNLFFTNGPNTCVGTTSLWIMMEHQVQYAVNAAMKLQRERLKSIEPKREAVADFSEWMEDYFPKSVFSEPVRTWYKDGREDGPVIGIWPGSNLHHLRVLRNPRWEDFSYEQLDKTKNRFYWFGNGMTLGEKALIDDRSWYLDDKYVDVPPVALLANGSA